MADRSLTMLSGAGVSLPQPPPAALPTLPPIGVDGWSPLAGPSAWRCGWVCGWVMVTRRGDPLASCRSPAAVAQWGASPEAVVVWLFSSAEAPPAAPVAVVVPPPGVPAARGRDRGRDVDLNSSSCGGQGGGATGRRGGGGGWRCGGRKWAWHFSRGSPTAAFSVFGRGLGSPPARHNSGRLVARTNEYFIQNYDGETAAAATHPGLASCHHGSSTSICHVFFRKSGGQFAACGCARFS